MVSAAYKAGYESAKGAAAFRKQEAQKRKLATQQRAIKKLRGEFTRGSDDNVKRYGKTWKEATETQRTWRNAMKYKGAGDYRGIAKWIPRGIGAAAGYLHSGMSGARQGWQVGGNVSKALGWGDYNMETNQIVNPTPQDQMQIQVNPSNASGDIIFDHTEFVGNVLAPGRSDAIGDATLPSKFDVASFAVNPGNSSLFPFLSTIASQFEMFEFAGLMVQYKPLSGESANDTNSLGKVMLCTNYDPSALPFSSSYSLENYDYSCSAKPSAGQVHGIETLPSQRLTQQLYVQTKKSDPGPAPQGVKDKLLTDLGLFQIATEGIPVGHSDAIVGELWVSYKIKLSRATLVDAIEHKDLEFEALRISTTFNVTGNPVMSQSVVVFPQSTLRCHVAVPQVNAMTITFPDTVRHGVYAVSVWYAYDLFISGSNLAHINPQGEWTYIANGSIVYPNTQSPEENDQLHYKCQTALIRLDHVDVVKTSHQMLTLVLTGNNSQGPVIRDMTIFVQEINGDQAAAYAPLATNTNEWAVWPTE